MADKTKIEWTDATWNPITGCTIVSPGCTNCYAMKLAGTRLKHIKSRKGLTKDTKAGPVWTGEVRFNEAWLDHPLRWKTPRMIFVCAHGDLFAEGVPDEWIDKVFAVMALSPQHTFQVLTKRPERMRDYLSVNADQMRDRWFRSVPAGKWPISVNEAYAAIHPDASTEMRDLYRKTAPTWPLANVWLGVSVEDQKRADERIPVLLNTPAAVRWISAEPLLGPIDLEAAWHGESAVDSECWGECAWCEKGHPPLHNCHRGLGDWEKGRSGLDWVVTGGESGHGARPMHPDWARSLRDQCASAGVAFHFKQWGAWLPGEVYSRSEAASTIGGLVRHQDGTIDQHGGQSDHWWSGDSFGGVISTNVGKKTAGRLLDGVAHDAFPEVRHD